MCLTIANATAIRGHQDNPPPARGFTRTRHHAGYLSPGDLWRPGDDQRPPHTVMTVSHPHGGSVVLTDQFGVSYRYSADAVIPTVVLDTWVIPGVGRGTVGHVGFARLTVIPREIAAALVRRLPKRCGLHFPGHPPTIRPTPE